MGLFYTNKIETAICKDARDHIWFPCPLGTIVRCTYVEPDGYMGVEFDDGRRAYLGPRSGRREWRQISPLEALASVMAHEGDETYADNSHTN